MYYATIIENNEQPSLQYIMHCMHCSVKVMTGQMH